MPKAQSIFYFIEPPITIGSLNILYNYSMKVSVIHSSTVKPFIDGALQAKKLFNEAETEHMSVSLITIDGVNKKIRDTVSDACYYIIEGSGTFFIEGKEYGVTMGDLVTIPKKSTYFDSGKMTMIVFRSPRYNPDTIEVLA